MKRKGLPSWGHGKAMDKPTAVCANCYEGIYREDETTDGLSHFVWYHMRTMFKDCDIKPEATPIQGTLARS